MKVNKQLLSATTKQYGGADIAITMSRCICLGMLAQ